jgi:hypothetical protein
MGMIRVAYSVKRLTVGVFRADPILWIAGDLTR